MVQISCIGVMTTIGLGCARLHGAAKKFGVFSLSVTLERSNVLFLAQQE